jgi:beta-lactamase regulating signal transducer with metallopeptidase domain
MNTASWFESALANSLLGALWQDAAIAALAALVLGAMARRTAAARHAAGMAFLVAMLLVPAWQLALDLGAARGAGAEWSVAAVLSPLAVTGGGWLPAAAARVAAPGWLAWAWCAGVLVMLLRLGGGWWLLRSLERRPVQAAVPPVWQRRAEALRRALGIQRPVGVRLLGGVSQPFSARAWRPVVWLPLALLTQLPPALIDALIAHELAHIRRLDWVWNGLQCGIEALLFFHPAVWWLSRQVRIEREHACDDLAAAVCGDPLLVAEALSSLARCRGPVPWLAQAAAGGSLRRRVLHLLSAGQPNGSQWGVALSLFALLGASGLWAAQSAVTPLAVPAAVTAAAPTAAPDPWWTYIGDSMRVQAMQGGYLRDYHAWVTLIGERHEVYRVDGQVAPIDERVRQWVASRHAPAAPPKPPEPPLPPLPPLPPEPPRLPELPKLPVPVSQSHAHQVVLLVLPQDAAATAPRGPPIRLAQP